jgi:hypothetical protein
VLAGIKSNLIFLGAIFPMLISSSYSHSVFAYNDPNHCSGYNTCYTIGYRDGYNDAQNGISPAYTCVGHENWCAGYNDGFRAGNDGSNIFYGQRSNQTANINVHGNNNKISVDQQSYNQMGFTPGHKSSDGILPSCVFEFKYNFVFEFKYSDQINLSQNSVY